MTTTHTLLKGDCLVHMKSIADKSVDLIICDLPFGCLSVDGKSKITPAKAKEIWGDWAEKKLQSYGAGCPWDVQLDLDAFWKEIKRIRKNEHTPCIHFCTTKYGYELIKSNEKEWRYDLVWSKERGTSFLTSNKMPMRSHEMIYIFSKSGATYNRIDITGEFTSWKSHEHKSHTNTVVEGSGINKAVANDGTHRCPLSVITMRKPNTKGHPTQKPLDLYKFLIERYSNEGDTVLDPTFGSCNSGLACKELKRKYIGCEMNEEFYKKGVEKMADPAV